MEHKKWDTKFLNLVAREGYIAGSNECKNQIRSPRKEKASFCVHGFVHRESNIIIIQQDATVFSLLHFYRQLYMFRVLTPIIRSSCSCNIQLLVLVNRVYCHPLSLLSWNSTTRADGSRSC